MSQQILHKQWTYQFRPGANPDQARATQAKAPSSSLPWQNLRTRTYLHIPPTLLTIVAVGLTASLLALAWLYLSADAIGAKTEYQRQQLLREVASLRARSIALRCQLDQRADLPRISRFALAAEMRPADPASESDFLSLSPAQSRTAMLPPGAWFSRGPVLIAAFVRQISPPPFFVQPSGRAEASQPNPLAVGQTRLRRPAQ